MKIRVLFCLLLFTPAFLKAEISLPSFFSDNMVLQRNKEVKIWGWADKGEKVSLSFNGQQHNTRASMEGDWSITMEPMKASSIPMEMIIQSENIIVIKNILIGEVWLCSGQSNMEWTVANSNNAEEEIQNANFSNIRLLTVPKHIAFEPGSDILPATWKAAVGENIKYFSAVGYFFGRHIHKSQNVPVGLISCNWGGTRAETWTSAENLDSFEYTHDALALMKTIKVSFDEYASRGQDNIKAWLEKFYPFSDIGIEEEWYSQEYNFQDWKSIKVPSEIEKQPDLGSFNGIIWYKKTFFLPDKLKDKDLWLRLGYINNLDEVWVNGQKIGETFDASKWRTYKVPKEALHSESENIITVRVFNARDVGGLVESNTQKISISPERWKKTQDDILLAGNWKFNATLEITKPVEEPFPKSKNLGPNDFPSSLYNGMLHPLIPFPIKGTIWYQGESNAKGFEDATRYHEVFVNMINNWRTDWGYDFEFYYVQLANFLSGQPECHEPCEQTWPYLRESQLKTLSLPNTGMAVTIDVGNPVDIHPRDKQTVGYRLGLIADAKAYGDESVVYSGPIYKSHEISGKRVILEFDHTGSGLKIKDRYGYLRGFQVAGEDKKFYWAKAYIENDRVIVFSDKVSSPVAVRYAWENNPDDANLYNKEGLPASPLRTDNWKLWTE